MAKREIIYPDLEKFFHPGSIAIAWASDDPRKLGGIPLKCALARGYPGKIFPVNPGRKVVQGLPSYPSIRDIPGEVDVALLIMRAEEVADALRQCVSKGIKAALLLAVGFAEVVGQGIKMQEEILEICRRGGLRICGPNTNGLGNVRERVVLGYSYAQEVVVPGRLGFVSQSGALVSATVPRFTRAGIGLSYFASAGNQADLEVCDYLKFMLDDPDTDAVALYLEGIKNPAKFLDVADRALARQKPLIVLKIGRSEQAARVAMAHTGSLVGSDEVFNAVCRQKGIIRVDDFGGLVATCSAFLTGKLPRGNRVGIMSLSGAVPGLITDYALEYGLQFPEISAKTKREAARILPGWPASGRMNNLWDIAAAMPGQLASLSGQAIRLFAQDENFDALIAVFTPIEPLGGQAIATALAEVAKTTPKPLVMLAPAGSLFPNEAKIIAESNIPVVPNVADCLKAVAALVRYRSYFKT